MEQLTQADRDELDDCYARCECPTCLRKRAAIERAVRIIDAYTATQTPSLESSKRVLTGAD